MQAINAVLTPNQWSRPQIRLRPVRGIVMHYVNNAGTSALFNRNFFENRKRGRTGFGSAHYIVDLTGMVVLCVPPNEIAYHCGEDRTRGLLYLPAALDKFGSWPNSCTLGIELCHLDAEGRFTEETQDAAACLVADLCERHDLDPVRDVVRHYDVTSKLCPLYWVNNGAAFDAFKQVAINKMLTAECGAENGN